MGRLFFYCEYASMRLAGLFTFGLLMFATERLMAEQSAPSTQPTPEVFLRLAAEVETNLTGTFWINGSRWRLIRTADFFRISARTGRLRPAIPRESSTNPG